MEELNTNKEQDCGPEPNYPLPPIRILRLEREGIQHYKAAINEHAEVKWQGIRDVFKEGQRMWDILPVKLELLRQTLEKYDFLNLDKPKDTEWGGLCFCQDLGTFTITAIFMDGSEKTIIHDLNRIDMPNKLHQLERRLETILGTRKWAGPPMILE